MTESPNPVDQSDAVSLVAWIRSCLDEDERIASWMVSVVRDAPKDSHVSSVPSGSLHIATINPARVLADVESKRRIVLMLDHALSAVARGSVSYRNRTQDEAAAEVLAEAVKLLALPYADRPGYLDAWRPA